MPQVAASQEKSSSEIRDVLAVVDTNLEGITNDISRLSASDQSHDQQVYNATPSVHALMHGWVQLINF